MTSSVNEFLPDLKPTLGSLRDCLLRRDDHLWTRLAEFTRAASDFSDILAAATIRRRAVRAGVPGAPARSVKLAIVGGSSLTPLHELIQQFLCAADSRVGWLADIFLGDYDNYVTELLQPEGALDAFHPDVILIIPSNVRCLYQGALTDARDKVQAQAEHSAQELLDLTQVAHQRTKAEIILANFLPTSDFDPGSYRVRTPASVWNFRKLVNLELGLKAPPYVQICDVEFLASRRGTAKCSDARMWFQAKQLYSPEFSVDVAREVAATIASLRRLMKKVLALDLDNTLWGGVIGDDGMAGIEIGDTSARGQAFKAFQQSIATLAERGVLLAVCSKNDHDNAMEPFEQHPEMVLRRRDIASFQANWGTKSESLRMIAAELNVGLDSIVFVDDNPAEIELVRQFVPEVETIQLGPDPAEYVAQLMNCRLFEPRSVTKDDLRRGEQYQQQAARSHSMHSQPDMPGYLRSLDIALRDQGV